MSYNPVIVSNTAGATKTATNNTGSTIAQAMPVKIISTGLALINPSLQADINALAGVLNSAVTNGSSANIVLAGIVENITTSFSYGDAVYIATNGTLTNQPPTNGVNGFTTGDFVIRIGNIVVNVLNPSWKDLLVRVEVVGQL